ncbi:hypothetical protein [Metallibacterium sp.]|uniref:hypothetical protein n=1 Tax=Metallibacterium sp. TaxID=2940281 RepID=UPI00260468FE|nr:hypothetical protein [Metallibacterium sp.]
MNTKTKTTNVATFSRATLPITCPACSASLGTIDVQNLSQRRAWGIAISSLDIEAPDDPALTAEAGLIRGACPSCDAELAAFWVTFKRDHGADRADEPQSPSLSLALHGEAYAGWAMIETHEGGVDCIEHLFGPVADERAEEAFEYVRDFMTDLPRPEAD